MSTTEVKTNSNQVSELSANKKMRYYRLVYRFRNRVMQKYFEFERDLKAAREEANKHCIEFGYRYIWVRPLIVNLAEQSRLKSSIPDYVDESKDIL